MQIQPGRANRIQRYVQAQLDGQFAGIERRLIDQVTAAARRGAVAARLADLDNEAARLAAAGERLTADNAVLRTVLADLDSAAERAARMIDQAAVPVQESAVRAGGTVTRELAIGGIDDATLARLRIRWNVPDPEAVARLVDYANSPGWADEISRYPGVMVDTVRQQAIRGMLNGWGPVRTAREIRRVAENLPAAQARTLARTLQLTSYRDAAAINQQANAAILEGQIRIGTLDARICMACVALHGQRLPVGVRVDDHHNGRCVGVPVVRGVRVDVVTGPEWFAGLPRDRQLEIAGPGALEQIDRGRARLADFAVAYRDQTFGSMIRRASIAEALESAAN